MKHAMKNHITMYEAEPAKFSQCEYTQREKEKLLEYMRGFEFFAVAGMVYDCVTGECTRVENLGYADEEFSWSSQDIYHLEKYNAAVAESFFSKVVAE